MADDRDSRRISNDERNDRRRYNERNVVDDDRDSRVEYRGSRDAESQSRQDEGNEFRQDDDKSDCDYENSQASEVEEPEDSNHSISNHSNCSNVSDQSYSSYMSTYSSSANPSDLRGKNCSSVDQTNHQLEDNELENEPNESTPTEPDNKSTTIHDNDTSSKPNISSQELPMNDCRRLISEEHVTDTEEVDYDENSSESELNHADDSSPEKSLSSASANSSTSSLSPSSSSANNSVSSTSMSKSTSSANTSTSTTESPEKQQTSPVEIDTLSDESLNYESFTDEDELCERSNEEDPDVKVDGAILETDNEIKKSTYQEKTMSQVEDEEKEVCVKLEEGDNNVEDDIVDVDFALVLGRNQRRNLSTNSDDLTPQRKRLKTEDQISSDDCVIRNIQDSSRIAENSIHAMNPSGDFISHKKSANSNKLKCKTS